MAYDVTKIAYGKGPEEITNVSTDVPLPVQLSFADSSSVDAFGRYGTPDELVLSVMPLSANADIHAALNWQELL